VLTHAYVNDIGIAFCHGYSANRSGFKIFIGYVEPAEAHVICLPKTAACSPHVVSAWITNDSTSRIGATTAEWSNGSPLNYFKDGVVIIGTGRLWRLSKKLTHQQAARDYRDQKF